MFLINKGYCYEFYRSEKSIEDIEGLASIESNIWACIYRALDRGQIVQGNTLESPSSTPKEILSDGTIMWKDDAASDFTNLNELTLDMEVYRSMSQFEYSISIINIYNR